MAPFLFCFLFSCPLLSFSLKVRVVSLPSFQRMTLSPMTRVTQTAAAVRVMMWTRKRSFWMSLWKGQPVLPTPTVLPKLPVPCSGLWGTPPAREPLEVLHPTPQHHLVRGILHICFFIFISPFYIQNLQIYIVIFVFLLFFPQPVPRVWYISTLPTYGVQVPSAPALQLLQQLWKLVILAVI